VWRISLANEHAAIGNNVNFGSIENITVREKRGNVGCLLAIRLVAKQFEHGTVFTAPWQANFQPTFSGPTIPNQIAREKSADQLATLSGANPALP